MEFIISVAAFLVALGSLSFSYIQAEESHKKQWQKLLKRVFGIGLLLGTIVFCATLTLFSIWQIYAFTTAIEDIRRTEVVMLIIHFINLSFYGASTFASLGGMWKLLERMKDPAKAAKTPATTDGVGP